MACNIEDERNNSQKTMEELKNQLEHMKTVINDYQNLICPDLRKSFDDLQEKYQTERAAHLNLLQKTQQSISTPEICKICYQAFFCNMDLQYHLLKIHDQTLNVTMPGPGYDKELKSKEENKRKRKGDENFDGEEKKNRKSKERKLSSKKDLQSSSCDESSKVENIQEKLIKRLRELLEISKEDLKDMQVRQRREIQEVKDKYRDKYATEESKIGRKHEEKLKAAMEALDTKWKHSQSKVQDWKEKYEKERDAHEQAKYFQKLYESQAKSLLELHHLHQLDQCGPWCTKDIRSIEEKSSKIVLHFEQRIKLLHNENEGLRDHLKFQRDYESQIKELQEKCEQSKCPQSQIKTEVCRVCCEIFSSKLGLKRHLEMIHEIKTIAMEKEPHKRIRKSSNDTLDDIKKSPDVKKNPKLNLCPQLKLAVKSHICKN